MTFQEAQEKFSSIIGGINVGMSPAELVQKQKALRNLQASLPNTAEFDSIAEAIGEFSPKLVGQITDAVVKDIGLRDASFREAANVLNSVSKEAKADARTLSLEQPKLVVAALNETVAKLKDIRAAAKDGKFEEAAVKADALVTLIQQVRQSIKTT